LRNPSRFSATDETTEQPIDQPLEQPLYGGVEDGQPGAAPELIRENPAEEMPREEPEPTRYGSINRPKTTPGSAPKTTHASLTPPDDGNQYLLDDEPRDPTPRRRFGAADNTVATTAGEEEQAEIDNNRIASIPSTGGKASLSAGKTKLPKNTSAVATSDPVPTTWGPWMLVCCALFLSIGGNLYLGWTAAEFYSRYRLTIERMRSGGRETDQD
jgi:hypothetical protein